MTSEKTLKRACGAMSFFAAGLILIPVFRSAHGEDVAPASEPLVTHAVNNPPPSVSPLKECSPALEMVEAPQAKQSVFLGQGGSIVASIDLKANDAESGCPNRKVEIHYVHNQSLPLRPASITKYETAYLIFERVKNGDLRFDDMVPIPSSVLELEYSHSAGTVLQVGKSYRLDDLVKAMMSQSNNWATQALAEYVAGSEDDFVQMMNATNPYVQLKDTEWASSNGLPVGTKENKIYGHTTAEDILALAVRLYVDFPDETYRQLLVHEAFEIDGQTVKPTSLKAGLDKVEFDMAKTGTVEGCNSLVTSKEKNGRQVFSIVLCEAEREYAHALNNRLYDFSLPAQNPVLARSGPR